jgi:hypothetical protein
VDLDPDCRRVGAVQAKLVAVLVLHPVSHRTDEICVVLAILGVDEFEGGSPDAIGDRVAGELLPGPVEQAPATLGVDLEDDLANVLHDRSVARFAVAQG